MPKYRLEFTLNVFGDISALSLKNSLVEFSEQLDIVGLSHGPEAQGRDFKICIFTDDPTLVFDACAQFGRIKAVKIEEKEG